MGREKAVLLVLGIALIIGLAAHQVYAEGGGGDQATGTTYKALGAALAIGLAGIGAGYAVGVAGASGLTALAERPEMFSNVLLIVALGEGIAIYGLIIAILILVR